jgi:hypothetical protein
MPIHSAFVVHLLSETPKNCKKTYKFLTIVRFFQQKPKNQLL